MEHFAEELVGEDRLVDIGMEVYCYCSSSLLVTGYNGNINPNYASATMLKLTMHELLRNDKVVFVGLW